MLFENKRIIPLI